MIKPLALFICIALLLTIILVVYLVKNNKKPENNRLERLKEKTHVPEQKEHLSLLDYNQLLEQDIHNSTPLEILDLGELTVSSGLVVVEDPLIMVSAEPFTKAVKPGQYPVRIVVAKTKESGDRYALAQLQFSKKKADKWVLALKKNDNTSDLKSNEYLGFPVDAGLACFADKIAANQYLSFEDNFSKVHPGGNIYDDLLADLFKKNAVNPNDPNDAGNWLNFKIPHTENNIILFQSGYGDGGYPCYWGVTTEEEIVSLVVDFLIFDVH